MYQLPELVLLDSYTSVHVAVVAKSREFRHVLRACHNLSDHL